MGAMVDSVSDKPICRKCSGSGEFANGGPCFDCNGSGVAGENRYTTTPASKSSNPALRAEREHKPYVHVPATESHVQACLVELRKYTNPVVYDEPEKIVHNQLECQHVFIGTQQICACGMWAEQFDYSINEPLET